MKRKKLYAAITVVALFLTGCSGGNAGSTATSFASVTEAVTSQVTTTEAAATTTAALTEEAEKGYKKGVNPVRTAEELAGKKVIALTFDDGPNTAVTNEILDVVEQYGIKASFFVIGENITPETAVAMQRAHSLGCEINSHSYTHSYMNEMSAEDIVDEMNKTADLIYEYVGEYPHFFRPPYIAVNQTMYDNIDLPFISGVGCNDWMDTVSVDLRVRFLTKKCREGAIILLHDQETNKMTAEAVRQAVPMMLEDGFEFVTVSELFVAKGITPVSNGIIYSYATENGN